MTDMRTHESEETKLLDLDVRILEAGDDTQPLITLTDDNCGSTCPNACASGPGFGEVGPMDVPPVR